MRPRTGREHGTRACYVFGPEPGRGPGCRCFACRVANSLEAQRLAEARRPAYRIRGTRNGWWFVRETDGVCDGPTVHQGRDRTLAYAVRDRLNAEAASPDPVWLSDEEVAEVQEHIRGMIAAGLGLKGIAAASGVNVKTVTAIHRGRDVNPTRNRGGGYHPRRHRPGPYRVRRPTGERILGVTVSEALDGHKVDGAPTWELLEVLLRAGYTKGFIARELGARVPALQIRRERVRAGTARKVESLYSQLWREDPRVRLAAGGERFPRRIRHRWLARDGMAAAKYALPDPEDLRTAALRAAHRERDRQRKRARRARRREEVAS